MQVEAPRSQTPYSRGERRDGSFKNAPSGQTILPWASREIEGIIRGDEGGYRSACIEPLSTLMVSVGWAADAPITESAAEAAIIIRFIGKD